ncbi:Triacylglycerol lipase 2 [Linum grandiflorum]
MRRGTITKYDYGNKDANMDHYGQLNHPVYNMSMIRNLFPLLFGYGGQDKLSDINDMQILIDNLKDHEQDKLVLHFVD